MASEIRIFGIRHHGPGSARRLVEALDGLRPSVVLVEGPADASELLPLLADAAMVPPVALLTYAADDPGRAIFWPFASYSPEYQAACWAVRNGAQTRFIDIPASWRLAPAQPDETEPAAEKDPSAPEPTTPPLERDPIGVLAAAGGYEDGESWWRDVIEENPEPAPVFAAIAEAMTALREAASPVQGREAAREAHMRLEIAKAAKETEGAVAVVCGAWHAPALEAKATAAADRALLKGAPKQKIVATFAPWTSPRLALASGYGAGVTGPGWCAHLWDTPPREITTRWLARIAAALREDGHLVSTASLIEAERLAVGLAALRGRPAPGFEELREAAVACLCFGETLLWRTISQGLLLGAEVGGIPANVPLAPLLEDLAREQKRVRLKPEALDRQLALDLRSESGAERSTLLHRLLLLGVPWGKLLDARGRGTFRERWVLRWEPEFAVSLVENLVHGATIAQAAAGRLRSELEKASELKALADLVFAALTARLPDAVERGIAMLEKRAAQTSDCGELLASLPPLADTIRYGEARRADADQLAFLFARILVQGTLVLPYAARGLDQPAAATMRAILSSADRAVLLTETSGEERAAWRKALRLLAEDTRVAPPVAGTAARLLYQAEELAPEEAALLLGRALSPGRPVVDAAGFFGGFFEGAGERLIHDEALREAVDLWVQSLEAEHFIEHLPLFRRAFANLDRMQRRRLLDALFGRGSAGLPGRSLAPDAEAIWPRHLERLGAMLTGKPADE